MLKVSQIAAKVVTRLFFILVLVSLLPYMQGDNSKLSTIYFTTARKWVFIFPCLLVVGFISLLIICTVKKYKETDLNWLLVLNTVILLAYGITVYVRVWQLVK